MKKPIVIFGSGGFASEVCELLGDINRVHDTWEILGFLDDNAQQWGKEVLGFPVLGGRDWLAQAPTQPYLAIGIGSPAVKRKIVLALREQVAGFPTLVHPSVIQMPSAQLGPGVVVTAGNILATRSVLSDFVMVNLACTVGHDVRLQPYATVSPGANISGYVTIGEGCDIGTGAAIVQGCSVGEWTIVGAGAVVARDLPANCTAVGVPAKAIKERPSGWHLA